jgi:hypothetical protein
MAGYVKNQIFICLISINVISVCIIYIMTYFCIKYIMLAKSLLDEAIVYHKRPFLHLRQLHDRSDLLHKSRK